jgi:hypothetical protein
MFSTLYGQTAAALYAKAAGQNAQARQLYNASADTYYKANDAAAYDDWVRARNHWVPQEKKYLVPAGPGAACFGSIPRDLSVPYIS